MSSLEEDDIKEVTEIDRSHRRQKIAYLFKSGKSMQELAKKFKLELLEVEGIIRDFTRML